MGIVREVKIGPSWKKLFLDLLVIIRSFRLLLSNRYDAVHSHEEGSFIATFLCGVFGIPHIYDMHSSLPRQFEVSNFLDFHPIVRLFERLERWTIMNCDALITITDRLAEHARTINPTINQKTITNIAIQNFSFGGEQPTRPQIREMLGVKDRILVVYTGNFMVYQGIEVLVDSARQACSRNPKLAFLLVGGNREEVQSWRKKVQELGLQDCVLFSGTVPIKQISAYLEAADILVSPRSEGTAIPLKVHSYLHAGKPIVATDIPAHSKLMDPAYTRFVDYSAESFAEAFLELAENPDRRRLMGMRAKTDAETRFGYREFLEKLRSVYETLGD
jgi:glycosyltransferase involved in cell wall biosynthesis